MVRLIPGGNKEAEVLLRATPHDMASMPDMTVVFRYLDPKNARAWTMTLRNFCGMFDWQPFAPVYPEKPRAGPSADWLAANGWVYNLTRQLWERKEGGEVVGTYDPQRDEWVAGGWGPVERDPGRPADPADDGWPV